MMGNVVCLDVITTLDLPVERILNKALDADLETVVIIGYTKEGEEYFVSSVANGGDVLWLLERHKLKLLSVEI